MPVLDVSDVVLDPLFVEAVTVTRNSVTVSTTGRNISVASTFNIYGVVNIGTLEKIKRNPEEEHTSNFITIHTKTKLYDVVDGFLPDTVSWGGNNFVVIKVNKWNHYGAGFYAVECEMTDLTANPNVL